MVNSDMILKKGDLVEVVTVNGTVIKGNIVCFEEKTVVVSSGVNCYLVKKDELKKQNYVIPKYERKTWSPI